MEKTFRKILQGYHDFREKYAHGDRSVMQYLSAYGQRPSVMVVACCDSRVDPALIMQCDPGDLFVVRNVANIVPTYSTDVRFQGTSAALEFGVAVLGVKHLILLGHSQCGGIEALLSGDDLEPNDFIKSWVSLIKADAAKEPDVDEMAKKALKQSYKNCLTFPWLKEKIEHKKLLIHLWFFDIKTGQIFTFSHDTKEYAPLDGSYITAR